MPDPELRIYGQIGGSNPDSVTLASFQAELDQIPKDTENINVKINSDGGSVMQAVGMVKALEEHPAKITTIVQGAAWSAAGYIACCGDERIIEPEAIFHIHGPRIGVDVGDKSEHLDNIKHLEVAEEALASMYSRVTGKDPEVIKDELFAKDTWLTADEAVVNGYMTKVGQDSLHVAALVNVEKYQIPSRFASVLARGEESKPKGDDMSTQAATAEQLRSEFPEASDTFILGQVMAKATLVEAAGDYLKDVKAQVKAAKAAKEAKAMEEEEEEPVAMDNKLMEKIVDAVVARMTAMEEEEPEAMEEEEEEVEAMEEEPVAMDESTVAAIAKALGDQFELQPKKVEASKSPKKGKGKRRTRLGAKAVQTPKINARVAARQSAADELAVLAKQVVAEKKCSLAMANSEVLRENAELREKLREEAASS